MIKVLIADDHAIVRHGLKQLIAETKDMTVAAEADSGLEALRIIRGGKLDVVLMDISMPGKNGIETLKQIRSERPDLPVVILSMYPEDQYAVRLIKAGAAGYLTKESAPEQLVLALRTVARGKKFITPAVAELLANELGGGKDSATAPHAALSDREEQIFRLLASGKTVSDVAGQLSLSVKTISTYRARVLEKMGMKNNAELTYYAIKNGLVE
jgi:two-component system, NarL family, invasion response regulator UvrY